MSRGFSIVPPGIPKANNRGHEDRRVQSVTPFNRKCGKKQERGTNTKHRKMSLFPPLPFPVSGPWSPREEDRFRIGRRIRKRTQSVNEYSARKQPPAEAVGADTSHSASDKRRRFGPALKSAQEGISRLWKKRDAPANPSTSNTTCTASSPLAYEDECGASKNSGNETPQEQLSESSSGASPSTISSLGMKLLKPLRKLRKRRVGSPDTTTETSGKAIELRLPRSCDEVDAVTAIVTAEKNLSDPGLISKPPQTTSPISSDPNVDENEALSVLEASSTACVEPSVADLSTATDCEEQDLECPKPRKRKRKKPRHGDDSVLIGMVITFDPTTELLEMGPEPQCVKRTMLEKLQKNDEYEGFLLGRKEEEEESAEELPSFSDLLGFHLDTFELSPRIDTSMEEEPECPFPEATTRVEDDIEIIFLEEEKGSKNLENTAKDTGGKNDLEEEIEIVFSPIESCCPAKEDEASHNDDADASAEDSNKDIDCESKGSEGSALPLEWMLPEPADHLSITRPLARSPPRGIRVGVGEAEPPEYQWFHPDHQNVEVVKQHTPLMLFGAETHGRTTSETPSTMGETMSFDGHSSFEGSEGSAKEVLSTGSLPSEAVQSLLEFCQSV